MKKTPQEKVIEEARTWIGTPWMHQGHLKGPNGGVDCAGFIAEVAKKARAVPNVKFEQNYRRHEDGATMLEMLRSYMKMVKVEDARPADVLALCDENLRSPDIPRHLIILTEMEPYWRGIHASERGVLEHRLDLNFKKRIHSVWRLKGGRAGK